MIMNISIQLKDRFYQLTAFGLGITYIFQIFLTIGGGTKFIPLTGVTLPLISYGGSSILTTLILFAITEGLYMIREEEVLLEQKRKKSKRRRRMIAQRTAVTEIMDLDEGETLDNETEIID